MEHSYGLNLSKSYKKIVFYSVSYLYSFKQIHEQSLINESMHSYLDRQTSIMCNLYEIGNNLNLPTADCMVVVTIGVTVNTVLGLGYGYG